MQHTPDVDAVTTWEFLEEDRVAEDVDPARRAPQFGSSLIEQRALGGAIQRLGDARLGWL
jgi:hypothetical protein